jgi:adenosylhomocysteine nucleosidase
MLAGPGCENAAEATEMLIAGHRPKHVVSAGFAGALSPDLKRNDLLLADRILAEGREEAVDLPPQFRAMLLRPGVHCGALLTRDRVVRLASEKRSLFQQHQALAVDMETFAVAEVCRRRAMSFSSIRVINDTADETLPPDMDYLLSQKPGAAQWGAALGAVLHRPGSAKDMYRLRENALVASLRLAKFLSECDFG